MFRINKAELRASLLRIIAWSAFFYVMTLATDVDWNLAERAYVVLSIIAGFAVEIALRFLQWITSDLRE